MYKAKLLTSSHSSTKPNVVCCLKSNGLRTQNKNKMKVSSTFKFGVFSMIAILILVIIGQSYFIKNTSTIAISKVTGKERVVTNGTDNKVESKYLIFTEAETFECTDQILVGKYNSSDVYGHIEIGKKYKFTVYGVRIPFLSQYRNIVNAEVVSDK